MESSLHHDPSAPVLSSLISQAREQLQALAQTPAHRWQPWPLGSAARELRRSWRGVRESRAVRVAVRRLVAEQGTRRSLVVSCLVGAVQ